MIARRTILKLGAVAALAPTITTAQAKEAKSMPHVFWYSPHPDDETLSMGLAMMHFIASGYNVHLVSMNSGGALGVANTLNGTGPCSIPTDHPYTHNPAREGYAPLTVTDIANARLKEARSAFGAMAMLSSPTPGSIFHHAANLPDGFGSGQTSDSTAPPTPEGIALAKGVIQSYVEAYPNSLHYTMSASDAHPDHAACGHALRELKNEDSTLVNSRFFVSRLYWNTGSGYPQAVLDEANGTLQWYGTGSSSFAARKSEYDAWLRTKVIVPYRAWNPAAGAFGIGYHQVPGQFTNNFGPSATIACLWHA
jgi:LmbE family N-acetylglucosaminyl deacetylase